MWRFLVTGLLLAALAVPAAAAGPDLRLVTAAAEQDKAAIARLVKAGVDVNTARVDGVTPLLWVAHWNDLESADLLINARANVNAADDHGITAVAMAAENGSAAMVEKLLKAGANPNRAQDSGMTPLMIATHTGSLAVVKLLLAHGANVNAATTVTGNTALMWAVAEHPELASTLIENGADVRTASNKGFTPLMLAARNGDLALIKTLLAAGAKVNDTPPDGTHLLPFAIVSGQIDIALFLLEQGADPNGAMGGVRAIHAAAGPVGTWLREWNVAHGTGSALGGGLGTAGSEGKNAVDLIRALIARGADINARITSSAMLMSYIGWPKKGAFEPFACGTGDLRGATPLWVAAFAANGVGYVSMGAADDEAVRTRGSRRGGSPISAEVVKTLLAAGADLTLTTNDGTTPLMAAAGLGRFTFIPGKTRGNRSIPAEEVVTTLLAAGADINAVNEADFTALHGAAFRGLNEVIKILVDRGADKNARDFRGRTAYRMAEGSKQSFQFQAYPETAAYMKELGFDTKLGIPGTVQERNRDLAAAAAAAMAQKDE
jgi:ankyrin repeat protein